MAITAQDRIRALEFPLDHVRARYQRSHGLSPAVALLHERELKRYLLLCAEHSDVRLPVSPVIDDLWHEFLLHTRDYSDFCRTLSGGFIHHTPMTADDSRSDAARRYERLLDFYEAEFGESPPEDVWPRSAVSESELADCDGEEAAGPARDDERLDGGSPRFMTPDAFGDCQAEAPPPAE